MKRGMLLVFAVVLVFIFSSPVKAEGNDPEREKRCLELLNIWRPEISEVEEALCVCKDVLPPHFYAIYERMANEYVMEVFHEAKAHSIGEAFKEARAKKLAPQK